MRAYERLDTIVRFLLIVLLGLLPFFFVPLTWVSATQAKIALASLILALVAILWIVARFLEGAVRIPWTSILITSAALPLIYAISTALSGSSSVSLVGSGIESDTLAFVA